MATTELNLDEIHKLAYDCLTTSGADAANADAVATTVTNAERDGSASHGLFRIPGYSASLKSGKVNGAADPSVSETTPVLLTCDGDRGYAPLAHARALPKLADAATKFGIAALAIKRTHHFAALWPETEFLAERNLLGMTGVSYKPAVAPAGGREALFGTNPISFAWPRPGKTPIAIDMATAASAMGEIMIAARDGHTVAPGVGLGPDGQATTDPNEILKGVLLPFGGYKGSGIAMMVELMAGAMIGETFSFEAAAADTNDGGPPTGGQFFVAISPAVMSGREDWSEHAESFFAKLDAMDGVRLPGERRHKNRQDTSPRKINSELVEKLQTIAKG